MERGFQSLLLTGKYEGSDDNFPTNITPHTQYPNNSIIIPSSPPLPYNNINIHNNNNNIIHILNQNNLNTPKRLKTEHETTSFHFPPPNMFLQLPNLQSLEQTSPPLPLPLPLPLPSPATLSNAEKAYKRRKTVSDKTQSLQKLLPVEKKMDMATVYEEAYKYIMFLKAQISVLESMPVISCSSGSNFVSGNNNVARYGGLGKLNRQQLLEVLVNSPATQEVLYSKGCCVYSLEQLMLFNDVVHKRFLLSDH